LFKRFRARLRYLIDRAFAREIFGQLLLLFVLTFSVTLIGMTALFFGLFADDNLDVKGIPTELDQSFLDSLWWSFNLVLDLRGFDEMYGASPIILIYALFLALVGLVALSLLISLINNTMQRRLEALRSGGTPVLEKNHLLILGWNNKVFSVLRQLAMLQPGLKVVILAPREINYMQEKLRLAGIPELRLTIILRAGEPSNRNELERVALSDASSVIILATDADDSETIKTLVLLTAKKDWNGSMPTLASEVAHVRSQELATIAARGRVNLISSSTIVSKVIVQTIRNPGLAGVLRELFSPVGNNIYVVSAPAATGAMIEDIAYQFADAIPIGISWEKSMDGTTAHAVALNPEPDYDITADEKLVVVARQLPLTPAVKHTKPTRTNDQHDISYRAVPEHILVIGWSATITDIMLEIDAHAQQGTEVTLLSRMSAEEARAAVGGEKTQFSNIDLRLSKGDVTDATAYVNLDLNTFDTIVVLADDSVQGGEVDTRTLRVLLRLSDLRKYHQQRAHTVVELTDAASLELFTELHVDDVIISPDIVSAQLAQVAQQPVLGPIYRELLSAGGVEIALRPASEYVSPGKAVKFSDLVLAAQQKLEVALGLYIGDSDEVLLNPARDEEWQPAANDQVVVLAQQVYQ
jgi:hypothetical protein